MTTTHTRRSWATAVSAGMAAAAMMATAACGTETQPTVAADQADLGGSSR